MKKLRDFFWPKISDKVKREVDILNIYSVRLISLIGAFLELTVLILVIFDVTETQNKTVACFSVGTITVFLFLAHFLTLMTRRRNKYNHILIDVSLVFFFLMLFGFSIYASGLSYILGKQIVTFYIIVVCFISFVVIPPIVSVPFVLLSFVVFFLVVYFYDEAATIQTFNFFAFSYMCLLASVIKYKTTINKIEQGIKTQDLNDKLEQIIRVDYLTKTKNRYALIEDSVDFFNKEIVVCMCDIDRFKNINDTYGHIMGDKVISAVANEFNRNSANSSIYRFGGDEFLLISDFKDEDEMIERKQKLEASLDNVKIEGLDEPIECSFGIVWGVAKNGNELEELITKADVKLYEEKKIKHQND